ncbi:MAG TPA: VOC family protein, partial [Nocardioidaceae bacterium]
TINVAAPDPNVVGHFYEQLLGWNVAIDEPGWMIVRPPGGGVGISSEFDEAYVAPTWPSEPGKPSQMLHLEIKVDDLEAAVAYATSIGARLAEYQPQEDVRVCLDPAGHPFCLWLGS